MMAPLKKWKILSLDGVVVGCPDIPQGGPAICEFKTHGDKSFSKLVVDGVQVAKFEHYVQMIIYMGKNNLNYALYMAVNKNTDELHVEVVAFSEQIYLRYLSRAEVIVDSKIPPTRISTTPGFFKCKFCDYSKLCHLNEMPAKNCRTCLHSRVEDNGQWSCRNLDIICKAEAQGWEDPIILSKEFQSEGCERWEVNPTIKGR